MRMRNINPRIFHLFFRYLRLGFELGFWLGLNEGLVFEYYKWVLEHLKHWIWVGAKLGSKSIKKYVEFAG